MEAILFKIPIDVPGTLAITPRPRGGDWLDDDIAALAAQGVGVVVSMLRADEQIELGLENEAATCLAQGVEFVALPVPDLGAPIEASEFIQAVRGLVARLRAGTSVAVHCRQSVGRSGLLAVSIAVAAGVTLESALEKVSSARGVRVPETAVQGEWLRRNVAELFGGCFHPTMLIETVREQAPEFPWLAEALANCGDGDWESVAYVGYVSRAHPNQPGADWQFEVNVVLTHAVLGMVVLDILKGDRLGGIEFVDRLSG
jgi:protein-tyrosine phosphatase